jgi:hypothetical protein
MTIPARWSLLSAALTVVTFNLVRAVYEQDDVGWSVACFVIATIAVVSLAVGDYLDSTRKRKD